MIARLKGILEEKQSDMMVVDVQGVGYELQIPLSTFSALPAEGEAIKIYCVTTMREDGWSLFGFASTQEKEIFLLLIKVNGIGPKLALAALSGMSPADLAAAISGEDVARICTISGVGKKIAERLVMELRDKMPRPAAGSLPANKRSPAGNFSQRQEVISALVNLGYKKVQAERAVAEVFATEVADTGAGLKAALRVLAQ